MEHLTFALKMGSANAVWTSIKCVLLVVVVLVIEIKTEIETEIEVVIPELVPVCEKVTKNIRVLVPQGDVCVSKHMLLC